MINAITAADIAFIMSSSTSAWLLSPLECSPQKQNGWTLCIINNYWIRFSHDINWIIKTLCLCYLPQCSASADNTDLGFDNSWYHAQPHPIIIINNNIIIVLNWYSITCTFITLKSSCYSHVLPFFKFNCWAWRPEWWMFENNVIHNIPACHKRLQDRCPGLIGWIEGRTTVEQIMSLRNKSFSQKIESLRIQNSTLKHWNLTFNYKKHQYK